MKFEDNDENTNGFPGGKASVNDGDPTYIQDEIVMPIVSVVETPPVKPGMGLVRD